jgi:RND family efflux transporter MFP subunit
MKRMRLTTFIATLSILLFACSPQSESNIPDDLDGKRALLSEKKKALKLLETEIQDLEAIIRKQSGIKPDDAFPLVETDTLFLDDFKKFISLPAEVATDDIVNISSENGGRILELNIDEGQFVKKGELIAVLDNESLKRQKAEMETRLDLANTIYERQKRLWDQNIGSEIQYLEAKNNKEALEKSLETMNSQLNKSNVYAPLSGTIESKISRQGEVVAPGQPMANMINNNRIKVVASVPESYLKAVKRGDLVEVEFPALNQKRAAKISLIGNTINPSNRSFKIEIAMSNPGGILKPNLLAEVKLLERTIPESISTRSRWQTLCFYGRTRLYRIDCKKAVYPDW